MIAQRHPGDFPDHDPEFEKLKPSEKHFRSDTSLEIHTGDKKALEAFKKRFLVGKEDLKKLKILVVNPGRNAVAEVVFPESDVKVIETSRDHVRMLKDKGIDAQKANFERRKFGPEFDIVIVLDPKAEPTDRFLYNIPSNGFILCRGKMANKLRMEGPYHIVGVVEERGSNPTLAEGPHGEAWGEVTNDEEFKAASKHETEGVVTYNEAVEALEKAHWHTEKNAKSVLENYKALLDKARENQKGAANNAELTYQSEEMKSPLTLNTLLPLKAGDDDTIFIVRKATIH